MLGKTPRKTGRVVEEAARQVSMASEGVRLKTGGGSLLGAVASCRLWRDSSPAARLPGHCFLPTPPT